MKTSRQCSVLNLYFWEGILDEGRLVVAKRNENGLLVQWLWLKAERHVVGPVKEVLVEGGEVRVIADR